MHAIRTSPYVRPCGTGCGNACQLENFVNDFSGGLTNYLYLCSLPDNVQAPDNQPRIVLLRVYGDIASKFVVENSVIFALMSEKRLGPKLYGMNVQARLEEYIPVCINVIRLYATNGQHKPNAIYMYLT